MHIPKFVQDRFLPFLMLLVCLATVLTVGASGISSIAHRHKMEAELEAIKAGSSRPNAIEELATSGETEFLLALAKGNVEKSNELVRNTDKLIKEMDLFLKKQDGR